MPTTDRRFPGEPRFPDLAGRRRTHGRTTRARRFFFSSAPLSAAFFARAVRAHWGVENRLNWVMDVAVHHDLMRLRTDHGPANMSTVRQMGLNLPQAVPGKKSLAVKKKAAG